VKPGTTLKMASGGSLTVNGILAAEGTAELHITFTSQAATPAPGDWGTINAGGSSNVSLKYCDVSYGGGTAGNRGIYVVTSNVQIRNSHLQYTLGDAVRLEGAGLAPLLEDVEIDHSTAWPIHQSSIAQNPVYVNLSFHDNGTDALTIDGSNVSQNVTLDGSPDALNGAPIYYGGGSILSPYTLTIAPGTTLKIGDLASLTVNGGATLIAEGTSELPITITSQEAAPQSGDWGSINVSNGSHVSMAYCDVGYGGGTAGNRIFYIVSSDVQIRHCRIHHSLGYGITIDQASSQAVFEDVELDHNAFWPILQGSISMNPTYSDVYFHDNTLDDALYIASSNVGIDVTLDGSPAALNGASIYYGGGAIYSPNTLTVTAGTTIKMANSNLTVNGGAALIAEGTSDLPIVFTSQSADPQPGDWQQIRANSGSTMRLTYCEVGYSGAGAGTRAVWLSSADAELHHCLIHHSLGDALFLDNTVQLAMQNLAIVDSGWSGISLASGSSVDGAHLTLARNGTGAYVASGCTLDLTNTILAQNTTGVNVASGGTANLTQTLWDRNTTPVIGVINETGHIDGLAGFDLDGYHITRYSAALGQGIDAGVTDDIDGDARPMPFGTPPDLGADEFPYVLGEDVSAEMDAFDPQWVVAFDPQSGEGYGMLRLQYLLRYYYGSSEANPPDAMVSITDTLPAELDFEYETHNPEMDFTQAGQDLAWEVSSPVEAGQSGEILLSSLYMEPEPGLTLVNRAGVTLEEAQGVLSPPYPGHFNLYQPIQVPMFAPSITSPGKGEICPDPSGNAEVSGTAQAGAVIHIYENDIDVATTTANSSGFFSVSFPSTHVGIDPTTTIAAEACAPSDPGNCSELSQPVTLTEAQSFWCPQRSIWEDDVNGQHKVFRFRNASGWFSTQDWVISGLLGFYDTELTLYACNCPAWTGTTEPPSSLWVVADGVYYYPSGSHPWYHFDITGGAHSVVFWAQCGSTQVSSEGVILIDPDGYVFDVSEGFDPISPTLHAVAGVTVTAYVSMPEWGGWVPWPAYLYDNQVNPQVTGEDGYFAFLTPPGQYYLQVDGIEGYQSWRSPVIEVITQVVHANVPYTPWLEQSVYKVDLTVDGPDPAVITIAVGEAVEWYTVLDGLMPPDELISLYTNPILRPLSDLDPLTDTSAWDGGMMTPGKAYRRQFDRPGTFTYTDGLGHSGTIIVLDQAIQGLSALNDGPTTLGGLTTLTATVTAGTNVTYTWDFGDESGMVTGAVVQHAYTSAGEFTATVTASNAGSQQSSTTSVSVTNLAPNADAGPDQTVDPGELVTLSGEGSSDPDGHLPLTYQWTQTSGATVTLSDPTAASPTFTAPSTSGTLVFTLVVTDSYGLASEPDEVMILVVGEEGYWIFVPMVWR
jgi:plastocyanin